MIINLERDASGHLCIARHACVNMAEDNAAPIFNLHEHAKWYLGTFLIFIMTTWLLLFHRGWLAQSTSCDYLMHTSLHMASSEPFHLLASLEQKAAIWYGDSCSLTTAQPDEETGKPRLAMNGQEIEIVVVASNAGTQLAMLLQICSCSMRRLYASAVTLQLEMPS